jgi:MFS family permease
MSSRTGLIPAGAGNLFLLACCQAVGQAGNTLMFTATALSVSGVLQVHDWATLPVTLQHLGVMLSVFPAAMLMQRKGRGFGFRIGSLMGMTGAALCGLGLIQGNFLMMCGGGLVLGYAVASLQMYRFAAVELVPPQFRAKAIAWVTAGGVVAGIIGPSIARATYDKWVPIYAATYAAMIGIHVTVFLIMGFIKFPPPLPKAERNEGPQRSLWEIATQRDYAVAVIAAMIAFGTMSFLMSASPLAIVGCGLPQTEAHWVIFMHVMGMFVPSFFTGNLIQRFGVLNIMLVGTMVFILGVFTGLHGIDAWNFRLALTLNGIGWNFLFVGATTLVTTTYRPAERGKAQALNDFLVFGTTATCSLLAGLLQNRVGWNPLNWMSLVLVCIAIAAVGWLRLRRPEPATVRA